MQYEIIPVTPFAQNCTLLWCDSTGEAALVDAGGDIDRLMAAVSKRALALVKLLVTHAHVDHVGAVGQLHDQGSLPIEGPGRADDYWIEALPAVAQQYGFPPARKFVPDRWLVDGDEVFLGEEVLQVLHCPGHTPGHVVFYHAASKLACVGDVLFAGSIGRSDFPGGDGPTLIRSIREHLFPLGDEVRFIPGHGPMSTLGAERQSNPFVADARFA
ncbi:MAG: MBL fold metallo-hydrolase [Pseudomonadales bacterium]|nr:MBL fold metallo-hydrolase [Pseudomonadales bacterium]